MAAGFTLKKSNLKNFEDFILKDFLKQDSIQSNIPFYMMQKYHHSHLIKIFMTDIKKLEPFGTANPDPTFLSFKRFKSN